VKVLGWFEINRAGTLQQLSAELAAVRAERAPHRSSAGAGSPPAVAEELIAMADQLDVVLHGANLADAGEELRRVRERITALLALCEVAPIVDGGELDFMRHEVVSDRPAPHAGLVDHIADTVRPGYRWRHDLLRPQQVVAYVDRIK